MRTANFRWENVCELSGVVRVCLILSYFRSLEDRWVDSNHLVRRCDRCSRMHHCHPNSIAMIQHWRPCPKDRRRQWPKTNRPSLRRLPPVICPDDCRCQHPLLRILMLRYCCSSDCRLPAPDSTCESRDYYRWQSSQHCHRK